MFDIDHKFSEVALCIRSSDNKRHTIALIDGNALITVIAKGEWDFEEIELYSPLAGDPETTIKFGHPLWDMLCESINHDCGDEIYTETIEVMRGDPDRKHDALFPN